MSGFGFASDLQFACFVWILVLFLDCVCFVLTYVDLGLVLCLKFFCFVIE